MTDQLSETLADIAGGKYTAPPKSPSLDEVINESFDFEEHLTEPPTYESREWDVRNDLLAAYIRGAPNDIGEILYYLEVFSADDWARAVANEAGQAFGMIKLAAEHAFESAIDNCIDDQFKDFCQSNGIYSHATADDPGDLIGFEMNHDGD